MRVLYLCVCVCVEGAAEITDCLYTRSGRVCSNLEGREKKQRGRYEMHIYKIFIVNNSAINCVLCGAITEEELPLTLTKRRRRRWGEHGSSDNNNNNKCLMDMLLLLLLLLGGGGRMCVCVCWKTPRTMQNFVVTQKTTTTHTNLISAATSSFLCLCLLLYVCVCVCHCCCSYNYKHCCSSWLGTSSTWWNGEGRRA